MPLLRELRGALTAFALVLCGLLVLVSYDLGIPGQPLLQSLRFHIGAALLGIMLLHLVSGAWWRAILFLTVAAVSVGQGALVLSRQQEARIAVTAQLGKPLLRILSFNLLQSNVSNGREIATFIETSGADVVLIMEAGPIKPFFAEIAKTYPYRTQCTRPGVCDVFLFSKTPLIDPQVSSMSRIWENRLIVAGTLIGGQQVTIVGAHMTKPYFDAFAEDEALVMGSAISRHEGPLVLAGDFNAAPWSFNIDRLARAQKLIPPPFYPATWPIRLGPFGVPIDNMWTRGPLYISSIEALEDSLGSNHRGLMAELALAPSAPPPAK